MLVTQYVAIELDKKARERTDGERTEADETEVEKKICQEQFEKLSNVGLGQADNHLRNREIQRDLLAGVRRGREKPRSPVALQTPANTFCVPVSKPLAPQSEYQSGTGQGPPLRDYGARNLKSVTFSFI